MLAWVRQVYLMAYFHLTLSSNNIGCIRYGHPHPKYFVGLHLPFSTHTDPFNIINFTDVLSDLLSHPLTTKVVLLTV